MSCLNIKPPLPVAALLLIIMMSIQSCTKFVEVKGPINSRNSDNVYEDDATAASVLTGIYIQMSRTQLGDGGVTSASLLTGLSSDELSLFANNSAKPALTSYYTNALTNVNVTNGGVSDFWTVFYQIIYIANSAIEGLEKSASLTSSVKEQLLGEAKFIRAFCYFYLVNLYGDVPLALNTNFSENTELFRAPTQQVWAVIVDDLRDAVGRLSTEYLSGNIISKVTDRVRPTKWAAMALLARTYLYTGDYKDAEQLATEVINNGSLFGLDSLNGVFINTSREAIWQLQPVLVGFNTVEARLFVLPEAGPNNSMNYVYLNSSLLNAFEIGDQRRSKWIDSVLVGGTIYYYPYKYKISDLNLPVKEYSTVFRLAEQYLIRSEARARLNNIPGALSDINVIRSRAGLKGIVSGSMEDILGAIQHERQVELFTEWGHRWFDMKRTKQVDQIMNIVCPEKGGEWRTTDQLYPIPLSELQRAPNLVQNNGY